MGISVKQLEEERVVLAKTFDELNVKIKTVENETQKMRNNLNAVHGALQQMDKLIKMERVLGQDGPAKPSSLEIEKKEDAQLLNESDK
jgi:uncharacterized coiled-coil protein SlyX|tara:strand:- start:268 stop:531 length:264 start_codon:yes stop_codon:yes gene_type:complete